LIHLLLAKFILHLGSKHVPYNEVVYNNSEIEKPQKFRKQVVFAVVNILFMFILSGIQFTLKPSPIFLKFNVIDLIFIIYLFLFIVFSFILPTGELKWRKFLRNFSYFILFIALFPLIALIEILREVRSRFKLSGEKLTRDLDNFLLNIFRKTWLWLHREKMDSLKKKNREQFISINRLIYDLPFFGLFFIGVLLAAIYFMLKWGDNPATTINDGHVFVFLKDFLSNLLIGRETVFAIFFISIAISIFLSEVINNATVIILMLPTILRLTNLLSMDSIILLLAVTLGATAVFMSPLGTNINAIVFASFQGVRLRRMMFKGLLMNIISLLWITGFLYVMHLLLAKSLI